MTKKEASRWCRRLQFFDFTEDDVERSKKWTTCYVGEKVVSDIRVVDALLEGVRVHHVNEHEAFRPFRVIKDLGYEFDDAIKAGDHAEANRVAKRIQEATPDFYRLVVPYLFWIPLTEYWERDLRIGYDEMERPFGGQFGEVVKW